MEFIINQRDTNAFSGAGNWLLNVTNCQSANGCFVDVTNNSVQACSQDCPVIKRDTNSGLYNYVTGSDTIFRRRVLLIDVPGNNDEKRLEVIVSWPDSNFTNFHLVSHIFRKREL